MPTYLRFPVETNPDQLTQDCYAYIQSAFPQWIPNDANLEVWLLKAAMAKAAENRDLVGDVQDTIFRTLGASLYGIPPLQAQSATINTTWTFIDTLEHTIPAGTEVILRDANGDAVYFQLLTDYVHPAGTNSTPAGDVLLYSMDLTADANGLGGAGVVLEQYSVLDFVNTITATNTSTGGADDEADTDYLNRLVRRLTRLSQRPIVNDDFATAALDGEPTLARVVALDGYDPGTNTWNHERTETVAGVNADGTQASPAQKTNMQTYLEANREVNFIIHVMDPNYTEIDVAATVVVLSTWDPTSVHDSVISALTNYLSSANWGKDPSLSGSSNDESWIEQDTVYYNDLIALVKDVQGVERVSDLTVNVHGNPPGRVDVALTSPAALTTPGTITCTTT